MKNVLKDCSVYLLFMFSWTYHQSCEKRDHEKERQAEEKTQKNIELATQPAASPLAFQRVLLIF
jgi:hypothetical protein